MARLAAGRQRTLSPILTTPSDGLIRPLTIRSMVVLPHPLGPRKRDERALLDRKRHVAERKKFPAVPGAAVSVRDVLDFDHSMRFADWLRVIVLRPPGGEATLEPRSGVLSMMPAAARIATPTKIFAVSIVRRPGTPDSRTPHWTRKSRHHHHEEHAPIASRMPATM